jgi:hypothetical protein
VSETSSGSPSICATQQRYHRVGRAENLLELRRAGVWRDECLRGSCKIGLAAVMLLVRRTAKPLTSDPYCALSGYEELVTNGMNYTRLFEVPFRFVPSHLSELLRLPYRLSMSSDWQDSAHFRIGRTAEYQPLPPCGRTDHADVLLGAKAVAHADPRAS